MELEELEEKRKSSARSSQGSNSRESRKKSEVKIPSSIVKRSLFIGGRPPVSSCGSSDFESLSRGHLRANFINFPTVIIRAKEED